MSGDQVSEKASGFIAELNNYLTNRTNADGQAITNENAATISDSELITNYTSASSANSETAISTYLTNAQIYTDRGAVTSNTSLSSARNTLTNLLADINTKLGSIRLRPSEDDNELNTDQIYLDMTAEYPGAADAVNKIRSIQFATDGSDFVEKFQELQSFTDANIKFYLDSYGTWLSTNADRYATGTLEETKYNELMAAVDSGADSTREYCDQYYTKARALYNHLQLKAYNSAFATDGSDLLVMGSDAYGDLLALMEGDSVDVSLGITYEYGTPAEEFITRTVGCTGMRRATALMWSKKPTLTVPASFTSRAATFRASRRTKMM